MRLDRDLTAADESTHCKSEDEGNLAEASSTDEQKRFALPVGVRG
jgi:hypothetical protein